MNPAEQRLEHLAREHGPTVLAYLARRVSPSEDAADVYAQVLSVTWRRLPVVPREDREALGWMIGVARRCLANHRRGAVRRSALADRIRENLRTQVVHADSAALEAADRILEALSEEDRELVTLVYWEDFSLGEAAGILGISAAAARKRMQRVRERAGAQERVRT